MIPFGNQTVTLLHRSESGYVRCTLSGCSWRMVNARAPASSAMTRTAETTCRIPYGQQSPSPGDLLVLGQSGVTANDEIALVRVMSILKEGGKPCFRVRSVRDNTNAPLPHYAATGE